MEYFFQRPLVKRIGELLELEHNLMVMVVGARRTGKTTAIRQALAIMGRRNWPTAFKSFDGVAATVQMQETLQDVWQQARKLAKQQEHPAVLALDEIQGVPGWHHSVKGLWDEDQLMANNVKVVITGSAPLLLAKGAADKLLGRHLPVDCPHWSFAEMAEVFSHDLDKYLFFGGYPFSGDEDAWKRFVKSMVGDYFLKDLLAVVPDIKNRKGMLRLLPRALQYAGCQISYSKLGKAVPEISNTTTLARYLDYFGQMRLVTGLQGYSATPHGKRTIPKIVVHNNALVTAGSSYSFAQARSDRTFWGALVENAVGAHLMQTLAVRAQLFYWRKGDDEVDYVVEQDGRLFAIEVKSAITGKQPRGLKKFKEKYARVVARKIPGPDMSLEEFFSQPASQTIEQWMNEDS